MLPTVLYAPHPVSISNEITDIGAKTLASNQSIQELIIHHNPISEEGKKMLNEQDPLKQNNYGIQSGVSSVFSLLKLFLFQATVHGLNLTNIPPECRTLKPRKIVDIDPLEQYDSLLFSEDDYNDRGYDFSSIDSSWKENIGKKNTSR